MPATLSDLIQSARGRIREISADDLRDAIDDGGDLLLVDVREPYEYEKGHIPGALLIPRGLLEGAGYPGTSHSIESLYGARQRTVVVVCNSGGRAAMAADRLQEMGFTDARSLAGGLRLWEAEDYEVEAGAYTGPLP